MRTLIAAALMAFCFCGIAERGSAQSPVRRQWVMVLKRGPKWIAGKPASEQPLGEHGRFLLSQMEKGVLQLAGPFLDDSGGLIVYNAESETEARDVEAHDPGVIAQILAVDFVRPFRLSFDATTGLSPFKQ